MYQPPTGPSGEGPNKKLVIGILGGAAVILLVIVLVIVFVEIRQNEPSVTSQGSASSANSTTSSETSTKNSSESSTAGSPTLTPPPTGAEGSDGDYTFSVAGTQTGDTITSNVSDAVQTTADGMFYVVYVNVSNTGTSPLTFVATFQQLGAAGQTFPLDDEATAFLGGTVAQVAPGDKVETPLVYDIPVGTTPDTILLRADPASPGVQLPLQ
jgi:cytoskeletal protein RodZ